MFVLSTSDTTAEVIQRWNVSLKFPQKERGNPDIRLMTPGLQGVRVRKYFIKICFTFKKVVRLKCCHTNNIGVKYDFPVNNIPS